MKNPVVLCVEEDQEVRQSYQAALSSNGYEVIMVSTAQQALAVYRFCVNVDLVIMDRGAQGAENGKLAERLKMLNPLLPVVMVGSGNPEPWEMHSCVDAAITKGAPMRRLLDRIEILLTERQVNLAEMTLLAGNDTAGT